MRKKDELRNYGFNVHYKISQFLKKQQGSHNLKF